MSDVVLSGYYGFRNAGDEAILYAMIEKLRSIKPEIRITVLSNEPEKTAQQYQVEAVNRWRLLDVFKAISNSRLLISGGGSLLQDVSSANSPLYYLGVIMLAKLLGKRTMVYAQGIGPLKRSRNRILASWLLNRVDQLTVRDSGSRDELLSLGVNRSITITSDPVLGLSGESIPLEPGAEILARNGVSKEGRGPLLGVFIRPWMENGYLAELAEAFDILVEEGWNIVFIPMQFPRDITIAKETAKLMNKEAVVLKEMYTPLEILSLVKSLDLVLGMRLHALISAAVMGIPLIGLSYDPKVDRFLQQVGQASHISVNNLRPQVVVEMVKWAYGRHGELSAELQEKLGPLSEKAGMTAQMAVELLDI